jgi:RNA polymerase sigma-70 factor (ECF subfamily)
MQKPLSSTPPEPAQSTIVWPDTTDQQLIEHISQGHKAAMTELVSRYYNRIFDFALRHVGRQTDAEDIVQETFFRVWQKAPQWQDRNLPPHSWLYRITYNLCIDELRRRKPESALESAPESTRDEHDNLISHDMPEKRIYQQQKETQLAVALESLSTGQRTAIVLCNFQDLSNRDAALVMDITVEAVESLLARGRKKLRKLLIDAQGKQS